VAAVLGQPVVFPEHDAGIDFPGRGCVAIRQQSAKQNGAGL